MFKFFILLALPLICQAKVQWMSYRKPQGFGKDVDNTHELDGFCTKSYRVAICFTLTFEKVYNFADAKAPKRTKGLAGAIIYRNAYCAFDHTGVEEAYVVMDSCEDIKSISLDTQNRLMDAPIENNLFVVCNWEPARQCTTFIKGAFIPSPETVWKDMPIKRRMSPEEFFKSKSPRIASVGTCDRAYSCLSCSAGRVCVPTRDGLGLYEISRYGCTEQYPYCNYKSGSCSDKPDPACWNLPTTVESKNFLCMRDGYYPDPTSCERFYVCKNKIAYEQFCPYYPTPYYHPELKLCIAHNTFCTDKTSSVLCLQRSNHARKVPILSTHDYFISCGVTNNVLSVDRCIGNYYFDQNVQTCVFKCPHQGLFLNAFDCTKYIKCTLLPNGGFEQEDKTCPDDLAFLESEFSCVNRDLVPNCKEPYPDLFAK